MTVSKVLKKLIEKYNNNKIEIEYVEFSYNELNLIYDKVANSITELGISSSSSDLPYVLRLLEMENKVELEVKSISDENINKLQNIYGETLKINVNNDLVLPIQEKARNADWNSLGAGIGIINSPKFKPCTSAGVAYNAAGTHFLMTAGHCLSSYKDGKLLAGGGAEKQYNSVVGEEHLNAVASGFDFGLIKITSASPITRLATNGLLKGNTSLSGYDAVLKGNRSSFYVNDTVCHSGLAVNYACGKVTSTRTSYGFDGRTVKVSVAEVQSLNNLSSGGDSGGPWYDVNDNLIGIHSGAPSPTSTHAYFTRWNDVSEKYKLTLYTSNSPSTIIYK